MSTENALAKYTQVKAELDEHIATNKPIFDAHQQIVFRMIDAENALRDAVAEAKQGVSNGSVTVTYTPQTSTFVDPEALKARQGQTLSPAVIAELVQTTERPPRITISQPKQ